MNFKDHGNGMYSVFDFKAADLLMIVRTVKVLEESRAETAVAGAEVAKTAEHHISANN
jgi:hypothetical protein